MPKEYVHNSIGEVSIVDSRTLTEAKRDAVERVNAVYESNMAQGITVASGVTLAATPESKEKVLELAVATMFGMMFSPDQAAYLASSSIISDINGVVTTPATSTVIQYLGSFITQVKDKELARYQKLAQIESATTIEAVDAI